MSAGLDLSRVVRSWLREDEHERADHVLEIVLARLDATPQRRSWWPARRSPAVQRTAFLTIAAAVVLAVGLVGYQLLPGGNVGGPPTPTPTVTPAPTVAATRSAAPTLPLLPSSGVVPAGTYRTASYTNTPFTLAVPAGWSSGEGSLSKGPLPPGGTGVLFAPWIVTHIYGDSCHWRGTMRSVGPTKAELVAALMAQTGRTMSEPTNTVYGGLPATELVFTVPPGVDASTCDDGFLRIWPDTGGSESGGMPIFSGNIVTVDVIETGGRATAIVTFRHVDSPEADVAELQSILESVVFVP